MRQLLRREVVGPAAEAAERDGGEEDYRYEGRWLWEGIVWGRGGEGREGEDPEGKAGGDLGGDVSAIWGKECVRSTYKADEHLDQTPEAEYCHSHVGLGCKSFFSLFLVALLLCSQ